MAAFAPHGYLPAAQVNHKGLELGSHRLTLLAYIFGLEFANEMQIVWRVVAALADRDFCVSVYVRLRVQGSFPIGR